MAETASIPASAPEKSAAKVDDTSAVVEERAPPRSEVARRVRGLILGERDATLSTLCATAGLEGHPFASVVPYALLADGRPVIYIADIATHTEALVADPRASLFVRQRDVEGDPQRAWRATIMGRMKRVIIDDAAQGATHTTWRVDAETHDEIEARYRAVVPQADGYKRTHGFSFFVMDDIARVRFIGGFGQIYWLDDDAVLRPEDPSFADAAMGAVRHMNDDHSENMNEMCNGFYGVTPRDVRMASLDRAGFIVRASEPDRTYAFSFENEVDAAGVRKAVIDVLLRARALTTTRAEKVTP
jgi:putative heme iron utilization protein